MKLMTRLRHLRRSLTFRGKNAQAIFDKVYQTHFWGSDGQGHPISGTGSHEQIFVEPYVKAVADFVTAHRCEHFVDLGCGDFAVGQKLLAYAKQYTACDVSAVILGMNRTKFQRDGLVFQQLDITKDALPSGDVAMVRQVLQHLSNDDIAAFVASVRDALPYRYLIVTEHIPLADGFEPNKNKRTGPGVRAEYGSGVVLHEAPFHLPHISRETLLELRCDVGDMLGLLVTTAYALKA